LGFWPQPPIPNPQSPIPNPHPQIYILLSKEILIKINKIKLNIYKNKKLNERK
jgi:hypothetical protein